MYVIIFRWKSFVFLSLQVLVLLSTPPVRASGPGATGQEAPAG